MSQTKMTLALVGVTLAAGAIGGALGMLCAPASGQELRRRGRWLVEDRWRTAARASSRAAGLVVTLAKKELESRVKRHAAA